MLIFFQYDFNEILIEKKGKEEKRMKEWKNKRIVSKLLEKSFFGLEDIDF